MHLTRNIMHHLSHLNHLKEIYMSAVAAVRPAELIRSKVQFKNGVIKIMQDEFKLEKSCYVVGFGKASFEMAVELAQILGNHLHSGVLSIPFGSLKRKMAQADRDLRSFRDKIIVYEGAQDNLPDVNAQYAAREIEALVTSLQADDVVFVLISGGGSALLTSPKDGISIREKHRLVKLLASKGATIAEINQVRTRLSKLKGGGLAKYAYPAKVLSLVLSDVIGDDFGQIASGPTTDSKNTALGAEEVLRKYVLIGDISKHALEVMRNENAVDKYSKKIFRNVNNYLIGSNTIACEGAVKKAQHLGYRTILLSTQIQGEVQEIAKAYEALIKYVMGEDSQFYNFSSLRLDQQAVQNLKSIQKPTEPVCLILGGEPTVVVNPNGIGGRNMHLALEVATLIQQLDGVHFISCGTDGIDGPTDAAGAISPKLNPNELALARRELSLTNSYTFFSNFQNGEYLIKIGHTGTNVMDIHAIIIDKTNAS